MKECTPAEQPHEPTNECAALCRVEKPTFEPIKCEEPDSTCNCGNEGSNEDSICFESLIAAQAAQISAAEKAKEFKAALESLLGKARAASQEYNQDKYEKLIRQWVEQDAQIDELIRKIVCAVPCWRCILECHVCRLVNQILDEERSLYEKSIFYCKEESKIEKLHNRYDLRYWLERDVESKRRRLDRISSILTAWESPAKNIEKALADSANLITDAGALLGPTPSKAVYVIFIRLVPLHLAIAPPSSKIPTKIAVEYTQFCKCDEKTNDVCCGVYVGESTVRERIIGAQPHLIVPSDYLRLICCLVENRYSPAKEAFAEATAELEKVEAEIKRSKALINELLKDFHKIAEGAIPSVIDCSKYQPRNKESQSF